MSKLHRLFLFGTLESVWYLLVWEIVIRFIWHSILQNFSINVLFQCVCTPCEDDVVSESVVSVQVDRGVLGPTTSCEAYFFRDYREVGQDCCKLPEAGVVEGHVQASLVGLCSTIAVHLIRKRHLPMKQQRSHVDVRCRISDVFPTLYVGNKSEMLDAAEGRETRVRH